MLRNRSLKIVQRSAGPQKGGRDWFPLILLIACLVAFLVPFAVHYDRAIRLDAAKAVGALFGSR